MTTSRRLSARTTWSMGQRVVLVLAVTGVGWYWWHDQQLTIFIFNIAILGAFFVVSVFKLISMFLGLFFHRLERVSAQELQQLDESDLPIYTLMLPLYHEANMIPQLIHNIDQLDYPKEKLDVLLLLEADDEETVAAARELPAWVSVVLVSGDGPKTKPRACNVGLERARGDFLVIYDAEDRPEPDQLKKSVAAFRRMPEKVVCLQTCLNYYNARQSVMTKWFTAEYSAWFDLFLPGLCAIGAPIPLGGTSNHFRVAALRAMAGWDAWNVTEDCDLGMNIARRGWRTRMLESTTWEEAVSQVRPWLRQRSRWVKGYWQTLLVHTRHPWRGLWEFGIWQYLLMYLVVGGHLLTLMLQPICWAILGVMFVRNESPFDPYVPYTAHLFVVIVGLMAVNLIFVLIHCIAIWQRRMSSLLIVVIGMPIYWALASLGAWRGVLQHVWAPFRWEKTNHGLTAQGIEVVQSAAPAGLIKGAQTPMSRRLVSMALLTSALGMVMVFVLSLPNYLDFDVRIRQAALGYQKPIHEGWGNVEENWLSRSGMQFDMSFTGNVDPQTTVFKAIVQLRTGDDLMYQQQTEACRIEGDRVHIDADFSSGWDGLKPGQQQFGPWALRRIKNARVKLYSNTSSMSGMKLHKPTTILGISSLSTLQLSVIGEPTPFIKNSMAEVRVHLSREYENPYDPRQIDLSMDLIDPTGKHLNAIAFYFQDYRASMRDGVEELTAIGDPEWRIRFTPRMAGKYRWQMHAKEHHGDVVETPWHDIEVMPSQLPGFIRVDPGNARFFSYENGDFFYPLGINLRSPSDNMVPHDVDYKMPNVAGGSQVINNYIKQMSDARLNVARIWMCPWFAGIEWKKTVPGYHGLGQYNLQNARRLDWILDTARKHHVSIDLALQNHGPFASRYDQEWDDNPYNADHGGPLADRRDVLTNKEAKRLFAQRLRYIAARWGADPAIFAWTMWIEVDAIHAQPSAVLSWHEEMIPTLRSFDNGGHPISTMFAKNEGQSDIWQSPHVDFTQLAAYAELIGGTDRIQEAAQHMRQFRKPAIIEEYGGSAVPGSMKVLAQNIHDGLWFGIMQDLAGTPYPWWWNFYFAKNLGRFHHNAAQFINGVDLRTKKLAYQNTILLKNNQNELRAAIRRSNDFAWAWIYEDAQAALRAEPHRADSDRMDWYEILTVQESAFNRLVGKRYQPLVDTMPQRFAPISGVQFELGDFDPGLYRVEYWQTWGDPQVTASNVAVDSDRRLSLRLPTLVRDIAVRILPITHANEL